MIDIHVHPYYHGVSKAAIVSFLDRYGIDKAWVLALDATPDGVLAEDGVPEACILNTEVWDLCRDNLTRFVPCFTLPLGSPHLQERIERYSRLGFRVFGEWKIPGLAFDAPECERVYEVLEGIGIPLLFHIGRSGFSERQLAAFERMISKYAGLTFIAHSMGWWKYISADWEHDIEEDYPTSAVIRDGPAVRLFSEHANLYANFDMVEGVNAMVRDLGFARDFLDQYHSRILYGSDYPCELSWPPFFRKFLLWRDCILLGVPTPEELEEQYEGYGSLARLFMEDDTLREDVFHNNAERALGSKDVEIGEDGS